MWSSLREFIVRMRSRASRLGRPLRFLVLAAIVVVAILILFWIFDKIFFYYLARSYVDEVATVLGVNRYLANAIAWATFAVLVILARYAFSFSKTKRRVGIFGVLALLIGQSLVLWYGTRDQFFDREGKAIKCYIITRQSIEYGERPGTDPKTGRECRPVTPEIVERLEKYRDGNRPKLIASANPVFFDPRTGNPIVWYYRDDAGKVEIFDLMGFDPSTGKELTPVTKEIVDLWNAQKELAARKAPDRIYPDANYSFFDPISGEPRVWYLRTASGEFEFYDRSGFSPVTGQPFSIISRDVIADWKKYVENNPPKKCFIITKETVLYRDHPGIDPVTGRLCRTFTPELLERLRLYEKGNRPKIIQTKDPTFFDLGTGEPIVWYYKTKSGAIELFDLMGFNPESGEELLPVSKEIVDLWKAQHHETPQLVDLTKYPPFDPVTGEPRVWYWRSDKGDYEFYNNPGFQPRTGESLLLITKEVIAKINEDTKNRQKQMEEERLQREREKHSSIEREEQEKREQAPTGPTLVPPQAPLPPPVASVPPHFLLKNSLGRWAIGDPSNCQVRNKSYFLTSDAGNIMWRDGLGNIDIELIVYDGETEFRSTTLKSIHGSGGEAPGTTWIYSSIGPDQSR